MPKQSAVKLRLLLGFVACVGLIEFTPQQVNVDWLHGTDFSRFKTYGWRTSPQPIADVAQNERIISDVDAQLTAKSLKKIGPDERPDLFVVYIAGKAPDSSAPGSYTAGLSGTVEKVQQNEASLKVYLEDPRLPGVVWCALGSDALADASDKNVPELEKLVQDMFKNYPPSQ
jgi:hypothetical protein